MRQSEYTTYYERWNNIKVPERGKLFMRHRGRAIYIRNGTLIDGLTGMVIPLPVRRERFRLDKSNVIPFLDSVWEKILKDAKSLRKTKWRSRQGGVITVNGKVITTKEDTHEQNG